jgi:hypothetical protein
MNPMTQHTEAATQAAPHFVYRHISFDLRAFDRLKDWQRLLATRGVELTNSQLVSRMLHFLPLERA